MEVQEYEIPNCSALSIVHRLCWSLRTCMEVLDKWETMTLRERQGFIDALIVQQAPSLFPRRTPRLHHLMLYHHMDRLVGYFMETRDDIQQFIVIAESVRKWDDSPSSKRNFPESIHFLDIVEFTNQASDKSHPRETAEHEQPPMVEYYGPDDENVKVASAFSIFLDTCRWESWPKVVEKAAKKWASMTNQEKGPYIFEHKDRLKDSEMAKMPLFSASSMVRMIDLSLWNITKEVQKWADMTAQERDDFIITVKGQAPSFYVWMSQIYVASSVPTIYCCSENFSDYKYAGELEQKLEMVFCILLDHKLRAIMEQRVAFTGPRKRKWDSISDKGSDKFDLRERAKDEQQSPMVENDGTDEEVKQDVKVASPLSIFTEVYARKRLQKVGAEAANRWSSMTDQEKKPYISKQTLRLAKRKATKALFKYNEEELVDKKRMPELYKRWRKHFRIEWEEKSSKEHLKYFRKTCHEIYVLNKREGIRKNGLNGASANKRYYYWIDERTWE